MPQSHELALARAIDSACDRFEADWRAGKKPRVDDYLDDADDQGREALRSALTAVESELVRSKTTAETSISHDSVRTGQFTAPPEPDPVRIGRFEVIEKLGEGAFGRVYRARDPKLDREVAIKVPQPGVLASASERERFLREAKAAATLHHPNICPVYEIGEENGEPFTVMAFIAGQSLAQHLKDRQTPLPEKQSALIIRKLALALQVAHNKGIVHRDLKPANIMFDKDRKDVVIMDFGLARLTNPASTGRESGELVTQSGVVLGTPAYMSPEQARGDVRAVGPLSDLYSLGVILYELLTGKRPYSGMVGEVIGAILHVEPPTPSQVRASVDPRLERICTKAMAKDPAARFASMQELADALGEYLKQSDALPTDSSVATVAPTATTNTEVRPVPDPITNTTSEEIVETATGERIPRWKILTAIGLLGSVLFVAFGIIFFARTPTSIVQVIVDVDLNDKSLTFFMDEKPIAAEELAKPIELKVGKHELIVKRGNEVFRKFTFVVSKDAGPRVEVNDETPKLPEQPTDPPKKGTDLSDIEASVLQLVNQERTKSGVPALQKNESLNRAARRHSSEMARQKKLDHSFDGKNVMDRIKDAGYQPARVGENIARGQKNALDAVAYWMSNPAHRTNVIEKLYTESGIGIAYDEDGELYFTQIFAAPTAAKPVESDPDRRAAEWFGEFGDGVEIVHQGARYVRKKQFPKEPFKVVSFFCSRTERLTDKGMLENLSGLTDVTLWDVNNNLFNGTGLACFKSNKKPITMEMYNVPITDDGMQAIGQIPQIEALFMSTPHITDKGLAHIAHHKEIQRIVWSFPKITDDGVAHLRDFTAYNLAIGDCDIGDKSLAVFSTWLKLSWLNVAKTKVTDDGMKIVAKYPNLQNLDISGTSIGDAGLAHLQTAPKLNTLNVKGTKITEAGIKKFLAAKPNCKIEPAPKPEVDRLAAIQVIKHKGVVTVSAGGRMVQVNGRDKVEPYGELPSEPFVVTEIDWRNDLRKALPAGSLEPLAPLRNLKILKLEGCEVGGEGLRHLAAITSLENLHLGGNRLKDADLVHLKDLTNLSDLNLDWNGELTGSGFVHLKGLTKLKKLSLYVTGTNDEGLMHLIDLPELESLVAHNTSVTGLNFPRFRLWPRWKAVYLRDPNPPSSRDLLIALKFNPGLQELSLNLKWTDEDLAHIAGLKELKSLTIDDGSGITDKGFAHLRGMTKLELLDVQGSQVTDDGIEHILGMTQLRHLAVPNRVTEKGIAKDSRQNNLPKLGLSRIID